MRYRLRTLLIVLAVGPPVLAGLGFAFLDLRAKPPSVFGRVTYRGKPVQLGEVLFFADDTYCKAFTDLGGRYRLTSDYDGMPIRPGRYRVVFFANRSARAAEALYPPSLPAEYGNVKDPRIEAHFSGGDCRIDFDL